MAETIVLVRTVTAFPSNCPPQSARNDDENGGVIFAVLRLGLPQLSARRADRCLDRTFENTIVRAFAVVIESLTVEFSFPKRAWRPFT
jgi:hypothetical protein